MPAGESQTTTLFSNCSGLSAAFVNHGTLRKTGAGSGQIATLCSVMSLSLLGDVRADGGTLRLMPAMTTLTAGRLIGGSWVCADGASIELPAAVTAIATQVELAGTGALRLASAPATSALASLQLIEPGAALRLTNAGSRAVQPAGGTLAHQGDLFLTGASGLAVTGGYTATPAATLHITATSTSAALAVSGAGTVAGHLALAFAPSFAPALGTEWDLATFAGGRTGTYASQALPPDVRLDLLSNAVHVTVEQKVLVADLAVSDIVAPRSVSAGAPLTVGYLESNLGVATATAPWTDRVDLATDAKGSSVHAVLGTLAVTADLAPGASAERAISGTAPFFSGTLHPRVSADVNGNIAEGTGGKAGEANNTLVGAPIDVLAANLIPGTVGIPESILIGVQTTIPFASSNAGPGDSYGPAFTDRLYLSADDVLDAGDILLGQAVHNASPHASGATLSSAAVFTLPSSTPPGQYRLILAVDALGSRFEASEADNTAVVGVVPVMHPPAADLVILAAEAPTELLTSQPFVVRWTVRNQGNLPATGNWVDQVLRSANGQIGNSTPLGSPVAQAGPLAPGAERQVEVTVSAPSDATTMFLHVRTDSQNQVAEGTTGEANNSFGPIGPIVVAYPPAPDLTVAAVQAPASVMAGSVLAISWTARNVGPVAATGSWRDGVALSTNSIAGDADDVLLGEVIRSGMAAGAEETVSGSFVVPAAAVGPRFLVVTTDRLNSVDERPSEGNNTAVSAQVEVLPAPVADLTVVAISAPATAVGTQSIAFSWTVQNVGTASTPVVWKDQVWLSTDALIGPGDTLLATTTRSGALAPGASYTESATATLPDYQGSFRLIVRTDAFTQVPQGANTASDVRASDPPTEISPPDRPDLVAVVTGAPASAQAGDTVSVTWTGTNAGTAPATGTWSDRIYLSGTPTLGGDAILLRTQPISTGGLAPAAVYTRTAAVQLPVEYSASTRFIIAQVDALGAVVEGDETNNFAASSPVSITVTPAPDLVVQSLVVPGSGVFGSSIEVSWTTRNIGELSAPGGFSDIVFLSTDALFSSDDVPVAVQGFGSAPLAAGASQPRSASVALPLSNAFPAGTYRVLVKTDANNSVAESSEGNNLAVSAPLSLTRPELPDLVVAFEEVPSDASFGSPFVVRLRVSNHGSAASAANCFLSFAASTGSAQVPLAEVPFTDSLAPGASVVQERQIVLPQIAGGAFTLQACVDSRDTIVEANELNNCALSSTIEPRRPDLVALSISGPAAIQAGQPCTVTYVLRNSGNGAATGFRGDSIFLSSDSAIGGDRLVAAPSVTQTIASGAEVTRTVTFTVPADMDGPHWLVVSANTAGTIDEGGVLANNSTIAALPTAISGAPRPNLLPVAASAPSSIVEGQAFTATFTVENTGVGAASGGWTDAVYATRLDGPGYVRLAAAAGPAGLAAGAAYTRTLTVPAPPAGAWRIKVVVDDLSTVIEQTAAGGNGEQDNTVIAQPSMVVSPVALVATLQDAELEIPTPSTITVESRNAATGQLVPGVSGQLLRVVAGGSNLTSFTTAADGRATLALEPIANKAGAYAYGVAPAGVTPTAQIQLKWWGARVHADGVERRIVRGGSVSGQVAVQNLGDLAIEGAELHVETVGSGISAAATLGAAVLGPNEARLVSYTVSVAADAVAGVVRFRLTTPKTSDKVAEIAIVPIEALPVLTAAPASIARNMLLGAVDFVNVTLTNTGPVPTGPLTVQSANAPFATLVTPGALPALAPGQSTVVTLRLSPSESTVLGPYTANPWIAVTDTANPGAGVGVPATFTATSDATATVRVACRNEFSFYGNPPSYPNAVVELFPSSGGEPIASGVVDAGGDVEFTRVPVGSYTLKARAPEHGSAQVTLVVNPGENAVSLFLPRVLVNYTWTVVPVPFTDTYAITISLTFATNVPAPVVTVDPVVLDLDRLDGPVSYREFTIRNHGLISAANTRWEIDNTSRYEIIPLSPFVGELLPGQAVVSSFLVLDNQFSSNPPGSGQIGSGDCVSVPAMRAVWELLCGDTLNKYAFLMGVEKSVDCPQQGPVFNSPGFAAGGGPSGGTLGGPGAVNNGQPGAYVAPNCDQCIDQCLKGTLDAFHFPCSENIVDSIGTSVAQLSENLVQCVEDADPFELGEALLDKSEEDSDDEDEGGDGDDGDEPEGVDAGEALTGALDCLIEGTLLEGNPIGSALASCGEEALKDIAGELPGGNIIGPLADIFGSCNCLQNQAGAAGGGGGGTGGGEDPPGSLQGGQGVLPSNLFEVPDSVTMTRQAIQQFANAVLLHLRMARPAAYQLGDFKWWDTEPGPRARIIGVENGIPVTRRDANRERRAFLRAFLAFAFQPDGAMDPISPEEMQMLSERLATSPVRMRHVMQGDLNRLVARWNRTISYWADGIFTAAQVPEGESTDFVDRSVMDAYQASATSALATVRASGYMNIVEMLGVSFQLFVLDSIPTQGVCTQIRIELEQTVSLERQAFEARLSLDNLTPSALESVRLEFEIVDANNQPAGQRFVALGPSLVNLSAVDGTGTLAAGESGSAIYTLIPGDSAAPNGPTIYKVRGQLSYAVGGQTLAFPLFPAQITVLPNPSLELNYFIETQVLGDDPFTPELEPSIPFSLGLWARNAGGGTAGNVRIESGEPVIVENERNLLIDFDLIGTQVGTEARSPSLAVQLGDIGPNEVRVAQWLMVSSLQGRFVDYRVQISSLNGFNTPEFAVVDSATIEPLVRAVRADQPVDDLIPDFLVNHTPDVHAMPDRIHLSEGAVEPVAGTLHTATLTGPLTAVVDAGVQAGWRYLRVTDPFGGGRRVASVMRSDGRVIWNGVNAWQTRFIDRAAPQPVLRADIHVFDRGGSGEYTITFEEDSDAPSIIQWASVRTLGPKGQAAALPLPTGAPGSEPRVGGLAGLVATFSEPIDPASFDAVSVSLAAYNANGAEVAVPPTSVTADLTLGGTSAEIAFEPALPSGLRYCVRVVGARDLAGNLLDGASARLDVAVVTGDVTGDMRVNVTDLGALATMIPVMEVDRAAPLEVRLDLNADGRIDSADLLVAVQAYGLDLRAAVNTCSSFGVVQVAQGGGAGAHAGGGASLDGTTEWGVPAGGGWRSRGEAGAPGSGDGHMRGGGPGAVAAGTAATAPAPVVSSTSAPSERLALGWIAIRAGVAERALGLTSHEILEAYGITVASELEEWTVARLPVHLEEPMRSSVLVVLLVGAGFDVGVVEWRADGALRVVGPEVLATFRPETPAAWQAWVLDSLHGMDRVAIGPSTWRLNALSRQGRDAWIAMRQLQRRREVMSVEPLSWAHGSVLPPAPTSPPAPNPTSTPTAHDPAPNLEAAEAAAPVGVPDERPTVGELP